jgi:hypothetical protein
MNKDRKVFHIFDKDTNQLLVETHYYKWLLEKQPEDIHFIDTKLSYLVEQGFKIGQDKVTETSHSILKSAEEHYFYNEIRNKTR